MLSQENAIWDNDEDNAIESEDGKNKKVSLHPKDAFYFAGLESIFGRHGYI